MQIPDVPEYVLEALHERGFHDDVIEALTPKQMFHEFCEWNGLINYSDLPWDTATQLLEAA